VKTWKNYIIADPIAMTSTADDEIGDQSASYDDDVIPLDGSSDSIVSTV